MKVFEGKSKEEKTKLILAIVLGSLALLAVGYNLFGLLAPRGSSSSASKPTPTPTRSTTGDRVVTDLPPQSEIDSVLSTIPVVYPLGSLGAPDAGRNIFAFYEGPIPTPWSPTPPPTVTETIQTPPPTPTPPQFVVGFSPSTVYAGTGGFTLFVDGSGFTPDTRIFVNNNEMPTIFVSAQRLSTQIPANFIASGGQLQIYTRSPDGKFYSLPTFFSIAQPPRPQFQYVGIVAPKLGNNATAYIQEGSATPAPKRLDDRIGTCSGNVPGCFRIVSIARERVIVQDVALGFRYTVEIIRPGGSTTGPGTTSVPGSVNPSFPNPSMPNPSMPNPSMPNPANPTGTPCIPGIPCDMKVYVPPRPTPKDVDDNEKDDGDN